MYSSITKETAERMFNDYSGYVFRVALFLTKSRELADDITQETFIKAFRKYSSYDPARPFEPWLYKIAINTARNMYRRQKAMALLDEVYDQDSGISVEENILEREQRDGLWQEINHLSLRSREVIVLHFYSGLKLKEIAHVLGIPLGTCKSRLNYALKTLKQRISQTDVTDRKEEVAYE